MPEPPLLSLRNVHVHYGRVRAVAGVSLDLWGGQLLGLIGPNGAGKTTILRAACGLQALTAGEARILGQDVRTAPEQTGRHLGFAPDTPALYDALTPVQFLDFIGRCYGLPKELRAERIALWLEQLWLNEKRDAVIRTLSRGMRQRLAVARALLSDPHVVLLDEPAAGLDPAGRVQFRQLLANLRDQGKAIIVSSHILADLAEYCTHIAIMERGALRSFGTVGEVAGAGSAERSLYRVRLARPVGDAAARLSNLSGVLNLKIDGSTLTFEADSDAEVAARLLAGLIARDLPVAEFRIHEHDLEEAYLRAGIRQVD